MLIGFLKVVAVLSCCNCPPGQMTPACAKNSYQLYTGSPLKLGSSASTNELKTIVLTDKRKYSLERSLVVRYTQCYVEQGNCSFTEVIEELPGDRH